MMQPELQFLFGLALMFFLFLLALIRFTFLYSIIRILEEKHPTTWKALGAPSSLYDMDLNNYRQLSRFISKGEYLGLNDDNLSKKVAIKKRVEIIFICLFVTGVILVLLGVFIAFF